jgi:hypothetical protein
MFDAVLSCPQQAAQPREDILLGAQWLLLWLKRLESELLKTGEVTDEAIVLAVQELNRLLHRFDLWRDRPHPALTPRFVAGLDIVRSMISVPEDLHANPALPKQLH